LEDLKIQDQEKTEKFGENFKKLKAKLDEAYSEEKKLIEENKNILLEIDQSKE
jgi:hypothetical protein